jgi:hypothetical protein
MAEPYTGTETKIYVAAAVAAEPANAAAYAGLTWTEIGNVDSVGEYGDEAAEVTANVLGQGRTKVMKGVRNAGGMSLVVNRDDGDTGQAAMVAAELTKFTYPFKVVYPNRLNATGTDGVDYFIGLVMSKRVSGGQVDSIVRRTFNVRVNSKVTEVAPTAGS